MTADKLINYIIKRNHVLKQKINIEQNKITVLQTNLNIIKSTKYFHLWRMYCHLKESIINYEK